MSEPVSSAPKPETSVSTSDALDLENIQGDIVVGLPKHTQTFYFFQILDPDAFRHELLDLLPLLTSAAQSLKDRADIAKHKKKAGSKPATIPLVGVNFSLSHKAFVKLGIDDASVLDAGYLGGQLADSQKLGDKGTLKGTTFDPDWDKEFKEDIDGLFLVAGDSHLIVEKKIFDIENVFKVGTKAHSIRKVVSIVGDVRPGKEKGHEHFGYLDGVSNPAIIGLDNNPPPGPPPIHAGVILLGRDGDANKDKRAAWLCDSSLLAFRLLLQQVPEFDAYLQANALEMPGLTREQGSSLLGARIVGRWKSGAPIDIAPFLDDPELGADPLRRNNFRYSSEANVQKICPFAAHIRRVHPRDDLAVLNFSVEPHRVTRRGISYGPEVTVVEKVGKVTHHRRGLLFACYQSSLAQGFQFLQETWANNPNFPPPAKSPPGRTGPEIPGLDPLIGQNGTDDRGLMTGVDPNTPSTTIHLNTTFVSAAGGEYFLVPSLKAIRETIAA